MNRKEYIFIAAAFLLASCAKAPVVSGRLAREIAFSVAKAQVSTKAGDAPSDFPVDQHFGVTAWLNTDVTTGGTTYANLNWKHFANQEVKHYSDGWKGVSPLYWPAGDNAGLDFFCYAPWSATPELSVNPANGNLTAAFVGNPDTDLLYTDPILACSASGSVAVPFKHVFSKLIVSEVVTRYDDLYDSSTGAYPTGDAIDCYFIPKWDGEGGKPAASACHQMMPEDFQNIWVISVNSIKLSRLASDAALNAPVVSGVYDMGVSSWTTEVSHHNESLDVLSEPIESSPNRRGETVTLANTMILPQSFNTGNFSSEKTMLSVSLSIKLFRKETNKGNDGNDPVFDYRDIYKFSGSGDTFSWDWGEAAPYKVSLRDNARATLDYTVEREFILANNGDKSIEGIESGKAVNLIVTVDPIDDKLSFAPYTTGWIETSGNVN